MDNIKRILPFKPYNLIEKYSSSVIILHVENNIEKLGVDKYDKELCNYLSSINSDCINAQSELLIDICCSYTEEYIIHPDIIEYCLKYKPECYIIEYIPNTMWTSRYKSISNKYIFINWVFGYYNDCTKIYKKYIRKYKR